jgi:hypothetical protein
MKAICLTLIGVCAVGLCLAQVPNTAPRKSLTPNKTDSSRGFCLLGSDCLSVSKTPVKACPVAEDSKAPDACAVDGMRFVSKLTAVERRT